MNPTKFISLYKYLGANHGVARLAVLEAADGKNMKTIAESLGCSTAAITGTVDRLIRDGCVKRTDVPGDRRQYGLALTDKGSRYLRQALDTVECPKLKPAKS